MKIQHNTKTYTKMTISNFNTKYNYGNSFNNQWCEDKIKLSIKACVNPEDKTNLHSITQERIQEASIIKTGLVYVT